MRKTILATAVIALVALGTAFGVVKSEDIKTFFASKELYSKEQTASASNAAPLTNVATAAQTPTAAQSTPSDATTLASTTTPSAAPTTDATTAPTDNSATLNNQTPSAGDDKTTAPAATATPAEKPADAAAANTPPAGAADATIGGTAAVTAAAAKATESKNYAFKVDVAHALKDREVGSKDAPLVVYDFSSLTCPHCAFFHETIFPKIKANYIDTGKVRWVYKGFPLNDPAMKAEMVARCAPEDQYEKLVDIMFKNQERWAFTTDPLPNLSMLLRLAGVSDDMFQACTNNKDLENALAAAIQTNADKYKVAATPTFVFNDGVKNFAGAGSYEGFATDLDQTLKTLTTPAMSTSSKLDAPAATPAPAATLKQ